LGKWIILFSWNYGSEDKKTWKTPISTFVTLTASSEPDPQNRPLSSVIATPSSGTYFYTNNIPSSWVMLTLTKSVQFCITHYAIKTRGDWDGYHLRNWVLEGSIDGKTWSTLSTHQNDSTLNMKGGIGKWVVSNTQNYFVQFRICQTGVNASRNNHLCFQNIEFYGRCKGH